MARLARPKSEAASTLEAEQAAGRAQKAARAAEDQEGIRGIEFSMTVETTHTRKGKTWIKAGGVIDAKPGETPEDARSRLVVFVLEGLEEQITEWLA